MICSSTRANSTITAQPIQNGSTEIWYFFLRYSISPMGTAAPRIILNIIMKIENHETIKTYSFTDESVVRPNFYIDIIL